MQITLLGLIVGFIGGAAFMTVIFVAGFLVSKAVAEAESSYAIPEARSSKLEAGSNAGEPDFYTDYDEQL